MKDIVALGLAPNFKKTMGVPGKRVKFLGFILDSNTMHMYVPDTRLAKLESAVKEMLEKKTDATVRELASVAGKVVAMVPAKASSLPMGVSLTLASKKKKTMHLVGMIVFD